MGQHNCAYCSYEQPQDHVFVNASTGDVTLKFASGNDWVMPDMILHYLVDHVWKPRRDFVNDVMSSTFLGGHRGQTKSATLAPIEVGYLVGEFEKGSVPKGFAEKLEELIREVSAEWDNLQLRINEPQQT